MTSPSRRDLFRMTGALGVAGAVGSAATLVAPAEAAAAAPLPGSAFLPADQDTHLLRRATYGPTQDSLKALRRQGRSAWLDKQLHPETIDDTACDRLVDERLPQLKWSVPEALRKAADDKRGFVTMPALEALARATWSKRQLFEVMVDFWSNHLNVAAVANTRVYCCRHHYDRVVIRRHALGRFEDMLLASAQSPAMMVFLNNSESTKVEPNENYGRELLELHTLGVDAGYTETDMRNSALIMTGFGVDRDTGTFRYDPADHHTGPVKVLDFQHANGTGAGGRDVGLAYLRYLARHPATARHLARKLCVRFVSDDPDPALVNRLADTYLAEGTAIVPVLRQLFDSQEFADSIGQKVRRPMEDVVATLRVLGYRPESKGVDGLRGLHWILTQMGHAPYDWSPPNGYPDVAAAWVSAGCTLLRWNRHLALAADWAPEELRMPGIRALLPRRLPDTYGELVDALARRLVFRTLSAEHKKVVLTFAGQRANDRLDPDHAKATWRMAPLVALILDSPYHGMR